MCSITLLLYVCLRPVAYFVVRLLTITIPLPLYSNIFVTELPRYCRCIFVCNFLRYLATTALYIECYVAYGSPTHCTTRNVYTLGAKSYAMQGAKSLPLLLYCFRMSKCCAFYDTRAHCFLGYSQRVPSMSATKVSNYLDIKSLQRNYFCPIIFY